MPALVKAQQKYFYPYKYGIMDRLFGSYFSNYGISWVKLPNGYTWKLDLNLTVHRWMVYGIYDTPFIYWAGKTMKKDSIIVDSGANIGQSTAYFSQIAKDGKVIAFEPDDEAFSWLESCIYKNGIRNVELVNKGLGNISKQAFLNVPDNGQGKGLHAFWSTINENNQGKKISVTTINDELKSRGVSNVSLWKLDVEGYEIPALEGAGSFLENRRIDALYIELAIKGMNHRKIIGYMKDIGYQLHYLTAKGIPVRSNKVLEKQSDGLFLKCQ